MLDLAAAASLPPPMGGRRGDVQARLAASQEATDALAADAASALASVRDAFASVGRRRRRCPRRLESALTAAGDPCPSPAPSSPRTAASSPPSRASLRRLRVQSVDPVAPRPSPSVGIAFVSGDLAETVDAYWPRVPSPPSSAPPRSSRVSRVGPLEPSSRMSPRDPRRSTPTRGPRASFENRRRARPRVCQGGPGRRHPPPICYPPRTSRKLQGGAGPCLRSNRAKRARWFRTLRPIFAEFGDWRTSPERDRRGV